MTKLSIIVCLLAVTPASAQWAQPNNQLMLQQSMDQMRMQMQMQQNQVQQQLQMHRLQMQMQQPRQCRTTIVGNAVTTQCF